MTVYNIRHRGHALAVQRILQASGARALVTTDGRNFTVHTDASTRDVIGVIAFLCPISEG
jgi:hypothetical protein